MYPQYSPRQSPLYQTEPQFNPTVQLSPRRVIPTAEDSLPVTFSPRTTVSPPRTITSPPRVIEYGNFEPEIAIVPPRVVEYDEPVVTISPERVLRMPERVTTLPPRTVEYNEPGDTTLSDLPDDVLIELLINLPPGKLNSLCGTTPALSRICNDEYFLRNLITRKYGVNVDMIPGQTIKEKYAFISLFDPKYFTDPNFVQIKPSQERDFGLNYTSRKNPNDALNTILSILNDSQTADDINVLKEFNRTGKRHMRYGLFSPLLSGLLLGAIMTKSQSFANHIVSLLMSRISENDLPYYYASIRYPFTLSIVYGMVDTTKLISNYYFHDPKLRDEIVTEIVETNSIEVLERLSPYIDFDIKLYWNLVRRNRYDLADYLLRQLREAGTDPYSGEQLKKNAFIVLRMAISNGNVDRVKYLMKYMTPTQFEINLATRKGFLNIARILQGQPEVEEVEDDMDIVDE